jgi:alpha-mannosidase
VKAAARSLCRLDGGAVIIESVKLPERGSSKAGGGKTLVLRLYESLGGPARTTLRFNDRPVAAVYLTDMLEENGVELPFNGNSIPLDFRPFEIKTLLVSFCS